MKNIYTFEQFNEAVKQRSLFRLVNNLKNAPIGLVKIEDDGNILKVDIEHRHPMKGKPEVENMKFIVDRRKRTIKYGEEIIEVDVKMLRKIDELCDARNQKAKKKVFAEN